MLLLLLHIAVNHTNYWLLHVVCIKLGHDTTSKCCAMNFDPLLTHASQSAAHHSSNTQKYEILNAAVICLCSLGSSSQCNASSAAQRIMGQNNNISMLPFILINVTGCSRTCWYFWNSSFKIL